MIYVNDNYYTKCHKKGGNVSSELEPQTDETQNSTKESNFNELGLNDNETWIDCMTCTCGFHWSMIIWWLTCKCDFISIIDNGIEYLSFDCDYEIVLFLFLLLIIDGQ